jgi:hypothetical protein
VIHETKVQVPTINQYDTLLVVINSVGAGGENDWFHVCIDCVGTGYRLNGEGQLAFIEAAKNPTKRSLRQCVFDPDRGRGFTWLVVKGKVNGWELFYQAVAIAKNIKYFQLSEAIA